LLADLIFGGGGMKNILLAKEAGGLLFAFVLGAAVDRTLGNDRRLPGGGLSRQGERGPKKQNGQCRKLFPHSVLL
jgi:hypothetical protein